MRFASAAHTGLYRTSRGRMGAMVGGHPVLLPTTIGRGTHRTRTTPVQYVRDGDSLIVIASNAGRERMPQWWLNLHDKAACSVKLGRRRMAVRAAEASGAERERLWRAACADNPGYARAEARSSRTFPVVVLEPVEDS